jgi:hypothetical protein
VGELVAHRDRDLLAQHVRVVAEVAPQRVAVDDDPVRHVVARDAVAVVQPVRAGAAAVVGDHHGHVALQRALQQVGQLVERLADELLEVRVVERVERGELHLVGLRGGALPAEPLGALHDPLEVLLALGL